MRPEEQPWVVENLLDVGAALLGAGLALLAASAWAVKRSVRLVRHSVSRLNGSRKTAPQNGSRKAKLL